MKYCISFAYALLASGSLMLAQDVDFEKEFDDFEKHQQKEYNDFKSKADAEFETFLREAWSKFDAFDPIIPPVRPEPVKQPVFDKTKPKLPPVGIKPAGYKIPELAVQPTIAGKPVDVKKPGLPGITEKPSAPKVPDKGSLESTGEAVEIGKPELSTIGNASVPGIYVPGQPYLPVKIDMPIIPVTDLPVSRNTIEFYGSDIDIATNAVSNLALAGNKEGDVADAWAKLCKADYEQLIKDCMTTRNDRKMSDWEYLLFTKKIGEHLYGAQQKDDIAFLQMFILSKSGYKVRLSKINEKLKLMIAPAGMLYGIPYIILEGAKYYVFDADKESGPMGVYTYKQDFADARNFVSLTINVAPRFDMVQHTEEVVPKSKSVKVESVVNKNQMNFYKNYPQCDVAVYFHTPMSAELKSSLYPVLKDAIKGKSQKEAANILIEFVQTGFEYQTDGDQFGYEKPFFLDENFFYPACDCEDRAILYSTLVKDLLGLDVILLDYPNHIASAVRFTEDIPGDYVLLEDGTKYLICDPTYIGASIGMCMEQFKQVAPEIIR